MTKRKVASLPLMPIRLKELRLEMGWSLDDVAQRVGVTHRSVAGNWEATNERRRTPDLGILQTLQAWYGVSLDYLTGNPMAERDSPQVVAAKLGLRQTLLAMPGLNNLQPRERAQVAVGTALELAPDVFFNERLAAVLVMNAEELAETIENAFWTTKLIERLAYHLGLDKEWFYGPNPTQVLEPENNEGRP